MQSCKGKFCFEEGNYLMQTSLIVIVVIAAVIAIAIAAWYLRKSLLFSKGTYGKQTVKSILKRYALSRNYKVLENVTLNYEGKIQTIDFVLVGFSGCCLSRRCRARATFTATSKSPAGALWTMRKRSALTIRCWRWTKRSSCSAA